MVAIQGALNVPSAKMGYALLIDSIDYAIWVMILLALVPFAKIFNNWTKSDTTLIDRIGTYLKKTQEMVNQKIDFPDLILLIGIGLFIATLSMNLAEKLPTTSFISIPAWTVIIVTIAGILSAMTPLAHVPGSSELSNVALYTLVGLIGSRANFSELTQAPLYIISGFLIIGIHALFMVLAARLFKLDLFTCGVASLANIGGVASAPILAAAYSEALIPIGVLMAMMGYVIGTGGGLLVGKILSLI